MERKKLLTMFGSILLAIVLAAIALVGGCAAPTSTPTPPPATEPIRLVFATWEGPESNTSLLFKGWAEELAEKTDGRVTIEFAFGSVMGPPPEHYDLAASGVADITMVGLSYTPGVFTMAEIWQMPIAGVPNGPGNAAFYELFQKGYFDNDFRAVKPLFVAVDGPGHYFMGEKPVLTFADMKDKKIRASGKIHTEVVQSLGSVPVGMAAPEIFGTLEKGTIDGAFTQYGFVNAFRTETVMKSVTELGLSGMSFLYCMNKDTWNSLPSDIKAIIDDMSPEYSKLSGVLADEWKEKGKKLLTDEGAKINNLSPEEMSKVLSAVEPLWEAWLAEGDAKGLERREMCQELNDILKGKGVVGALPEDIIG